jgi:hypothetical protein
VRRTSLLLAALALAACGSERGGDGAAPSPDPGTTTGIEQTQNDLRIDVDRGDGSPPPSRAATRRPRRPATTSRA